MNKININNLKTLVCLLLSLFKAARDKDLLQQAAEEKRELEQALEEVEGKVENWKRGCERPWTVFANHFRLFCTRLSMGIDDALLWFTWDKQVVSKLHCCKIFVSKYSYLHFGNLMAGFRDLKEILFSTNRNLLAEDLELFEIKYFINREKLNFNGKLPNNLE